MSRYRFFAFLLLAVLAATSTLASAGIRGPSPSDLSIRFEPGRTFDADFAIDGSEALASFLGGDLAQYATIEDSAQGTGPRSITVHLKLPERMAPAGDHVLYVGVREGRPENTMVGGVAAAQRSIHVFVLYDEPLLVISSLTAESVAVNTSTTPVKIVVSSLTTQDLPGVYVDFRLLSANGTQLDNRFAAPTDVPSGGDQAFSVDLPTKRLDPGPYLVTGIAYYAHNTTNLTVPFRVGSINFSLESYPPNLTVNMTNKFVFTVRSNWVEDLRGVNALVQVGPLQERTPDADILQFGDGTFKAYLDTHDVPLGPVTGFIRLSYSPDKNDPNRRENMEFPIRVNVVPEYLPELEPEPSAISRFFGAFAQNPMLFVYVGLVVLVILNVVLLFLWKRKRPAATER